MNAEKVRTELATIREQASRIEELAAGADQRDFNRLIFSLGQSCERIERAAYNADMAIMQMLRV